MTTTAAISGQSIGTSTNIGDGRFPQKVTANAASTAFNVAARVTDGAGPTNPGTVRVWFSSSSFNITAAVAVAALGTTARYLDVNLVDSRGSQIIIRDSTLEPLTGGYIYLWCSIPSLGTAATLDVNVVEVP